MPSARQERHVFELDGGTIALDFVNTVSGMRGLNPRDRLIGYDDLVYWAEQVGLIDAAQAARLYERADGEPGAAAKAFVDAIRSREALHDVVLAAVDGRAAPVDALETVNRWIAEAMSSRRFQPVSPGRFEVTLPDDGNLLAFLRPVAIDAAELLEHEVSTGRVGICDEREAGHCAWLFLDTSRNNTRRYCNMKECGNRAKQRRHYRRSRAMRE